MKWKDTVVRGTDIAEGMCENLASNFKTPPTYISTSRAERAEELNTIYYQHLNPELLINWQNIPITTNEQEIRQILEKISEKKNPGPMMIAKKTWYIAGELMIPALAHVLTTSWDRATSQKILRSLVLFQFQKKSIPSTLRNTGRLQFNLFYLKYWTIYSTIDCAEQLGS